MVGMFNKKGECIMSLKNRIIQLENMISIRVDMNKKYGKTFPQDEIDKLKKELNQAKIDLNKESA
ncbi:MAG TPA: hypothetical protein DCM40_01380 [Maribacter sp.]|nr:hypothetical protein [Maribacter sp.]